MKKAASRGGLCGQAVRCRSGEPSGEPSGARALGGDPDLELPTGWDEVDEKTGAPTWIGKGWGYAPGANAVTPLREMVEKKLITYPPVIRQALASELAGVLKGQAADNAGMKPSFAFMGQRPGLAGLPPLPVVELTGEEFGADLSHRELVAAASAKLRAMQGGPGLPNDDTNWDLRINRNSRKKIGDNEDQSIVELRAVAGIERLTKHAVVGERHADLEHRNPDIAAVLRLYAPLAIDGVLYRVKLTVKDYSTIGDPKMLHALAAVEIENAPLGTLPAYSSAETLQQAQPTTGRTVNIADLMKNATRNDGGSYAL